MTWIQAATIVDVVEGPVTTVSVPGEFTSQLEARAGVHPGFIADTSPWLVLGVVVFAVALLGALYLFVRIQQSMHAGDTSEQTTRQTGVETDATAAKDTDSTQESGDETTPDRQVDADTRERILDQLPEDERKILGPVLESPGLTQVDVRDRSGFSKSKVSQTVNDLEDRGLLTREREGRTYAVYPPEDIDAAFEADKSS